MYKDSKNNKENIQNIEWNTACETTINDFLISFLIHHDILFYGIGEVYNNNDSTIL